MEWTFSGTVIEWRGPAPFLFVAIDRETSAEIKEAAAGLEYWGQVAVGATINAVEFTTALFPKDGRYLLPLKAKVRQAANVDLGDIVEVSLELSTKRG